MMRKNKAYILEFETRLRVVNEKLRQLEKQMIMHTDFENWWPLRQAYNHLLHEKKQLQFKLNNARQGRNPWGQVITEKTLKTPEQ